MQNRIPRLLLFSLMSYVASCGLLDSETAFTIETDWQDFNFDMAALGLVVPQGQTIPEIPCSAANDPCAQSNSMIECTGQDYECKIQCGKAGTCEVQATVDIHTTVDVSQKIKNNTQASALKKVTLLRVIYNTDVNTMNFDTPQFDIYVGPNTASKVTDSAVVLLGTMSVISSGAKPNDQIKVTSEGEVALANFVKDYQTPFRLFVRINWNFASGSPIPQGRLQLKFKAHLKIEPMK